MVSQRVLQAAVLLLGLGASDAARTEHLVDAEQAAAAQEHCENAVSARVMDNHFGNLSAARKCRSCLDVGGKWCQWCPLTQTCMATGWFGSRCTRRVGQERLDRKIKFDDKEECDERGAAWEATLSQSYGKDWLQDGRHDDVSQCARWALDWALTDEGFKEEGAEYDTKGRWGCVSALIREGVLAMTRKKHLTSYTKQAKSANIEVWNPALCSIIKVKENKETCYVRGYAPDQFHELRKVDTAPNFMGPRDITDELAESMMKGPIKSFNPGAGKSGSGFGSTADGKFKVKFGLKHTNKMDEVKNLMDMVIGDGPDPEAGSLAEHFRKNPNSMLNRQYALIKVAFGNIRTYVVVLADAFYHMNDFVKSAKKLGAPIQKVAYDLKGASRNQHERSKGSTKLNGDFTVLEKNRLELSDSQCLNMRGAIKADTEFLSKYNIIDYSMLMMSIRRPAYPRTLGCRRTPGEPYCYEHGDRMYTLSIIDYLNNHNWFKGLESAVRMCKFCSYGKSVTTYVKRICRTRDEQGFIEWINAVIQRNYDSTHQAFHKFDEDKNGKLTEGELDTLFQSIRLSPENSEKLLDEIDKDDDGAISFPQFQEALQLEQ